MMVCRLQFFIITTLEIEVHVKSKYKKCFYGARVTDMLYQRFQTNDNYVNNLVVYNGLVQDCSVSIAYALEIMQSCI